MRAGWFGYYVQSAYWSSGLVLLTSLLSIGLYYFQYREYRMRLARVAEVLNFTMGSKKRIDIAIRNNGRVYFASDEQELNLLH